MTDQQKILWDLLPVGVWVERDKMDWELKHPHRSGRFQRALSYLYDNKFIELEFRNGIQYIRRKTITELVSIMIK